MESKQKIDLQQSTKPFNMAKIKLCPLNKDSS